MNNWENINIKGKDYEVDADKAVELGVLKPIKKHFSFVKTATRRGFFC